MWRLKDKDRNILCIFAALGRFAHNVSCARTPSVHELKLQKWEYPFCAPFYAGEPANSGYTKLVGGICHLCVCASIWQTPCSTPPALMHIWTIHTHIHTHMENSWEKVPTLLPFLPSSWFHPQPQDSSRCPLPSFGFFAAFSLSPPSPSAPCLKTTRPLLDSSHSKCRFSVKSVNQMTIKPSSVNCVVMHVHKQKKSDVLESLSLKIMYLKLRP